MNLNDRIALELGRAVLARIVAEAKAENLEAQLATKDEPEPEPKSE